MMARKKAVIQFVLLLIAAVFIIHGATRGEAGLVLAKAVKICLECIGIG